MSKALIIGGSAGSFQVVIQILQKLPARLNIPVFLCMHRLRHVRKGFEETLAYNSSLQVREPFDKEAIRNSIIYLAPANYHMLIEEDRHISLSTENPIHHSRPSIDLGFASAADVYGNGLLAILLSGANHDGTAGIVTIKENLGTVIIQDPQDCEIATMCESALKLTTPDHLLTAREIVEFVSLL